MEGRGPLVGAVICPLCRRPTPLHPLVGERWDREARQYAGIFSSAFAVLEETTLPERELETLRVHLDWLIDHTDRPRSLSRHRDGEWDPRTGHYGRAPLGVCWYRASADRHLEHARALAAELCRLGERIDEVVTERPGILCFEDEVQLVAIPFRDARWEVVRTF